MDKAPLVDIDVKIGADIVGMLDRGKVRVNVALLAYLSEYEDWRLVLAGRKFDSLTGSEGYRLVHDTLSEAGMRPSKTPTLMILPMKHPLIAGLRRMVGKTDDPDGTRLRDHAWGDTYLIDGYAYRIK
jgi:hypothetical protein